MYFENRKKHHLGHYIVWTFLAALIGGMIVHFPVLGIQKIFSSRQNAIRITATPLTVSADSTVPASEEIVTIVTPPPFSGNHPISNIVSGITMFRGNATRSWYGAGVFSLSPKVIWKYPEKPMCSKSTSSGKTRTWCGSGWTGQPVVWERSDGITEVIFGAYDKKVHFVDAATGQETRPSFETDDIIKGSVTLDPDGFPLLYFGSRDNKLRIVALDQETPVELWSLDSKKLSGIWNDDWDANPLVLNDILYMGGENGHFYIFKLNRSLDESGNITVKPTLLVDQPSYNDELLQEVGRNVSIENSPSLFENRIYFANSGGRILGLDISQVENGTAPIVFDYWAGDDIDASIVIDQQGMLYVAIESERFNERSKEINQLIKLDPLNETNPLIWSVSTEKSFGEQVGGIWATPALAKNVLYVPTHSGTLMAVDTENGSVTWQDFIGSHAWSSPNIIGDKLFVATCQGTLRSYDIQDPKKPLLLEITKIGKGSCIESTPAFWGNTIFVGSRDGFFYALQ